MKIVECVPNISEGRRKRVIDAVVNEVKRTNAKLLDVQSDEDHNRSVITFAGSPDEVQAAASKLAAKAVELIDLNEHRGAHPRMGAVDVIPFVPIEDITMEECVALASGFAEKFADTLEVPVFLYGEAARMPARRNLANVRRGEFEGLREQLGKTPERMPDFGPKTVHATAGCTAIGARMPLIAFNVNLSTDDISIANKIARAVRHSTGGLRHVKALGIMLKERNLAQVSMNLVNYKSTPVFRVFELIKAEARRYGVGIVGSELIGLAPLEAFTDVADYYLQLEGFDKNQILEARLEAVDG